MLAKILFFSSMLFGNWLNPSSPIFRLLWKVWDPRRLFKSSHITLFCERCGGTKNPISHVRKVLPKRTINNANEQNVHINKQTCSWEFKGAHPTWVFRAKITSAPLEASPVPQFRIQGSGWAQQKFDRDRAHCGPIWALKHNTCKPLRTTLKT